MTDMVLMCMCVCLFCVFFKQKTAYEMRISDWSSDVCSSDLRVPAQQLSIQGIRAVADDAAGPGCPNARAVSRRCLCRAILRRHDAVRCGEHPASRDRQGSGRSEEHTSELQSLMRISYAVFCLKKKKKHTRSHARDPEQES